VQLEKEREQLKMEVSKGVVKIKNTDMAVAEHLTNIVNLNRIIGEADAEKMQLKKDLETAKSERDVLGIQVKLFLLFTL
jgi:chromosome segregation ATPase